MSRGGGLGCRPQSSQNVSKKTHHSYQADQGGPTQSDDHAIPHDYYSGPPEPQPGSYPGSKQLTSKNTMYAELQGSLMTQGEGLLLQGRVETSLLTEAPTVGEYCKMPPPPPPKKGEQGYEHFMKRMAAEEQKYHEEQAKK